ncbi:MAG: ABC transporter permease [Chloroflexi bacterium]|nr:ABC transporter permease [Chloroflexota bacterium]
MGRILHARWQMAFGLLFVSILFVLMLAPSIVAPYDPYELNTANRLRPPSPQHLFGTDEAGRDIFSRIIYGTRYSLGMSLAIVGLAVGLGTAIGCVAGLSGGRTDELLMRFVDVFLSFPRYILAMAIASALGPGIASSVLALSALWWAAYARLVRGKLLSIKENLFVEAARALGTNNWRIVWWHVLPHCVREINAKMTLDFGTSLLALTGLGFLGLGMQNPAPEWGLMVANARGYALSAWWYAFSPGLMIFLCVLSFVAIGDTLSEGSISDRPPM